MASHHLAELIAAASRLTPLQVPDLGGVAAREVTGVNVDDRSPIGTSLDPAA